MKSPPQLEPRRAVIDLDKISEIAQLGVRRAAIFMGLAVDAAGRPEFRNYRLKTILQFTFIPENAPDPAIAGFKKEFAAWVISCGLREMVESFAVYLDRVYALCLNLRQTKPEEAVKRHTAFERFGVDRKLRILAREFNIRSTHADLFPSLNRLRNCLAHRRGIVSREDCKKRNTLIVTWRGMRIFGTLNDGREQDIPADAEPPFQFDGEARVSIQFLERRREFPVGAVIRIAPHELAEICWSVSEEAAQLTRQVADLARVQGRLVQTHETPPVEVRNT